MSSCQFPCVIRPHEHNYPQRQNQADEIGRLIFIFKTLLHLLIFLKSDLSGVGGTEHRAVGKVLHKLVKYSVASQFCFKGQNDEKRCFENTEVK